LAEKEEARAKAEAEAAYRAWQSAEEERQNLEMQDLLRRIIEDMIQPEAGIVPNEVLKPLDPQWLSFAPQSEIKSAMNEWLATF